MTRRPRTTLQRAAIFEARGGVCHICGERIDGTREPWELEHRVAYQLTRDDSDDNLSPAHVRCHAVKTKADVAAIARAKRVSAKHTGAHKPKATLAGSKGTRWKRKIDGSVVPR